MKYIKSIYIGLVGMLMAACTDELPTQNYGDGEGRLVLSEVEVKAAVGDVITRASLETDILPKASDFTIEIVNSEGSLVKTLEPGTLQCTLSAGTYTLKASYGDAEAMSATPAFYGESNATIIEGGVTTTSITANLQQAVIHPRISEELIVHFKEYSLTIQRPEGSAVEMPNDKDFFIPGNGTYTLTLSGTNQLGESFSHDWQYENLAVRTRYTVECNPDLPSFTMPEQPEGNVWSKFVYITPMTADNMTSHQDMADKVLNNIVYEASSDGITWIPSEIKGGKVIITKLEANTKYTLRSRFGAVCSNNTFEITTESAQQVENGDMESTSKSISMNLYGARGRMYCYHFTGWDTRNELTTNGAEEVNITNTNAVQWKYCSNTRPINENNSQMAEISTLAFYNGSCGTTIWDTEDGWFKKSILNEVKNNGTVYTGILFTGIFNKSTNTPNLGILHHDRPMSFSFDYSYTPVIGDKCLVYAQILDINNIPIAQTENFQSEEQSFTRKTLKFIYSDKESKAYKIIIYFQSGTDTDVSKMRVDDGSGSSPKSTSRVVGSVLKIDNVTLNYDYE